jgi:hypothetical protein
VADPAYAEWLQQPERLRAETDAPRAATWGARSETSTVSSAIALEADAGPEALRHLDFKAGPVVEEQVVVPKRLDISQLRGRCWTVQVPGDAAYAAGALVYVLGGVEEHALGVTRLDVLRRL